MNFYDILLAKKLENDQDPTVEGLTVTQNGSYSEQGVVYDVVNVALPLDSKTITANGNYKASDDNLEGYTEVDVNVPLPSNAYLKDTASSYPIQPSLLPLPKAEVTFSGDKAELFVGSEPIVVTEDNAPYIYRQSPSGSYVDLSLVGGTVAWNQLVQTSDTSCTVPNAHKYIFHHGTTYDVAISDGNAFTVDGSANDNVHDITQAFGSTIADYIYTLEQSTAGSGIAWLKSYGFLTKDYYEYQSGKLESVNVSSRKVVGFNQLDESLLVADKWLNTSNGNVQNTEGRYATVEYTHCMPSTRYYFLPLKDGEPFVQTYEMIICWYDVNKNYIGHVNANLASSSTVSPSNAYYFRFGALHKYDLCINIYDTAKNGTYEPYTSTTYPFDSTKILRGIPKLSNGQMYYDGDVMTSDGTITRNYEERAYQSGDESLADAITDGTNTVVKLQTPTTESATPFTNPQLVGSTEEFTDATSRDVMIPCGQDSNYANSDIYISYGTSPIDMAKEHAIIPYTSTYIDSNGSEDVEYWS